LTGLPVDVAVDIPKLELDRPFTYLLPEGVKPETGLVVSVPFHGRTIKGWVLGPAAEMPGRVLPVRRVLSKRPVIDERLLALCRWMSDRYVAPLSVVIDGVYPPRVAAEEERDPAERAGSVELGSVPQVLGAYESSETLLDACRSGSGGFVARPLPDEEAAACIEAVAACLEAGRDAVVLVPEADPQPTTARLVAEAFGDNALVFAGGDKRKRYRSWLEMMDGRYRVVVGTRPAVFAPVSSLGLVWVHREAHPGHREERAPYYHVRDVALARARLEGAVCVLSGLAPSAEAVALADAREVITVRPPRSVEREAAPLVETAKPEREDRSPRLASMLGTAPGAFLLVSTQGYGIARVCRSCGEPARCQACSGTVVIRGSEPACAVCGSAVSCPNCGARTYGVERGGTERVEEWARHVTGLPVARVETGEDATPPRDGQVIVGSAAAVKDLGPQRVALVGILDPDRARRRAGLSAPGQALATWMEAAAWAGPRRGKGRVLVQTRDTSDPAIQALIRWDPWHLHRAEAKRRAEAGFPVGHPVFRVVGGPNLERALAELLPVHLLTTSLGSQTVSLITLRPEAVTRFRERVRKWAADGTVERVEAEPQL
jgi:primosomal protein N' (replication factor Y) (superfamily II helicase)